MQLHDRLDDGKTEAGAMPQSRARPVGTVKTIKYMRQVFRGNSLPRIANDDLGLVIWRRYYIEQDATAAWGMAQCIRHKIT